MATKQTTAEATAKAKQEAEEKYNELVAQAKQTLMDKAKSYAAAFVAGLIAKTPIKTILTMIDTAKSAVKTAENAYTAAETTAATVKATAISLEAGVNEGIKQAADLYKNGQLNTSNLAIDIGATATETTIASVDPATEPNNSSAPGLYVQLMGAHVKLNSIQELETVVKTINEKLNSYDVPTTRAWVHRLSKLHPLVDEKIKNLDYFKPICNEVGTTYLQHTPDTQTLALTDWATTIPNPFRRSLANKMDDSYIKTRLSYYKLNKALTNNLSSEYYYDSGLENAARSVANNYLNKDLLSNDFHIAGDFTFGAGRISGLYQVLMTALIAYVGGSGKLINWLAPVNSYSKAICSGVLISIEGKDITVDLRGNKMGIFASVIDKTPITPEISI